MGQKQRPDQLVSARIRIATGVPRQRVIHLWGWPEQSAPTSHASLVSHSVNVTGNAIQQNFDLTSSGDGGYSLHVFLSSGADRDNYVYDQHFFPLTAKSCCHCCPLFFPIPFVGAPSQAIDGIHAATEDIILCKYNELIISELLFSIILATRSTSGIA